MQYREVDGQTRLIRMSATVEITLQATVNCYKINHYKIEGTARSLLQENPYGLQRI